MNLFKYLYVAVPHSSQDNLALSSKPNTTKRTETIKKNALNNTPKSWILYVEHTCFSECESLIIW